MIQKKKDFRNRLLEYLAEEAVREWNEAVRYLTGENIRFASPIQAQQFLEVNKDNFYTDNKAGKRM